MNTSCGSKVKGSARVMLASLFQDYPILCSATTVWVRRSTIFCHDSRRSPASRTAYLGRLHSLRGNMVSLFPVAWPSESGSGKALCSALSLFSNRYSVLDAVCISSVKHQAAHCIPYLSHCDTSHLFSLDSYRHHKDIEIELHELSLLVRFVQPRIQPASKLIRA